MSTTVQLAGVVAAVAALVALASIWRSPAHSSKVQLIWTLLVLIPFIGPTAWFLLGRGRRVR